MSKHYQFAIRGMEATDDSNTFQNSPPKRIWLQWWGDADPSDLDAKPYDNAGYGVTWCKDKIFDTDIEYVLKEVCSNE